MSDNGGDGRGNSPPRAGSGSPGGDGDDKRAARSRSRSRSPAGRPASPPKGGDDAGAGGDAAAPASWKATLDGLIADGKVREGELDTATFDALAALPADQAALAVSRFADSNFSRINNKSGFLLGIVRRIQNEGDSVTGDPLDVLKDLPDVKAKLQAMIDDGRLSASDIDHRMAKALADLGPRLAAEAVDKFEQADLATIRSKAGFFMGICRRLSESGNPRSRGGPRFNDRGGDRGGPYGGGGGGGWGQQQAYGGYGSYGGPPQGYGGAYGGGGGPYGGGGGGGWQGGGGGSGWQGGGGGGYSGDRGGGYGDRGGYGR